MIIIGLTGGSGAGKGCVAKYFSECGIETIDTDHVSRQVCQKGSDCLKELVSYFGDEILLPDGSLDRKRLAELAFSDETKHKMLNSITHKYILLMVDIWLETQKKDGKAAAIVDAPLLYESGFDNKCDKVIAVIADKEIRIARIIERDGITEEQAEIRLKNQHPSDFYSSKADYTITNNGSLDDVSCQVKEIYDSIFGKNYSGKGNA